MREAGLEPAPAHSGGIAPGSRHVNEITDGHRLVEGCRRACGDHHRAGTSQAACGSRRSETERPQLPEDVIACASFQVLVWVADYGGSSSSLMSAAPSCGLVIVIAHWLAPLLAIDTVTVARSCCVAAILLRRCDRPATSVRYPPRTSA
jgi:hypothetical protein